MGTTAGSSAIFASCSRTSERRIFMTTWHNNLKNEIFYLLRKISIIVIKIRDSFVFLTFILQNNSFKNLYKVGVNPVIYSAFRVFISLWLIKTTRITLFSLFLDVFYLTWQYFLSHLSRLTIFLCRQQCPGMGCVCTYVALTDAGNICKMMYGGLTCCSYNWWCFFQKLEGKVTALDKRKREKLQLIQAEKTKWINCSITKWHLGLDL